MASESTGLAGIVLAAGAARRFGAPKQVALLSGETLVARAVRLASGCCDAGVLVVTGAHAEEVTAALSGSAARPVFNADWPAGMSTSLAAGVAALPAQAAACLVMLCDQVALTAEDLHVLRAAWRRAPHAAAAAGYAGASGVPAIFPAMLWPQLTALHGDSGARCVLAVQPQVTVVALPHAAVDVDTAMDLERVGQR